MISELFQKETVCGVMQKQMTCNWLKAERKNKIYENALYTPFDFSNKSEPNCQLSHCYEFAISLNIQDRAFLKDIMNTTALNDVFCRGIIQQERYAKAQLPNRALGKWCQITSFLSIASRKERKPAYMELRMLLH